MLGTIDPSGTVQASVATIVTTCDSPGASVPNVTVGACADPPHTPPGAVHDTSVSPAERPSVTTTFCAANGPSFVTVIENVTCDPAATVALLEVIETRRSAVGGGKRK